MIAVIIIVPLMPRLVRRGGVSFRVLSDAQAREVVRARIARPRDVCPAAIQITDKLQLRGP